MKQTSIVIFVILSLRLFSQEEEANGLKDHYFNAFQPRIQYEKFGYNNLSLGVANLHYVGESVTGLPWLFHGAFLDVGLAFNNKTELFSGKIGYEYFFLFLGGRLNLVNYTDFKDNQLCMRPEIGLSLLSFLTITYGYNIDLSGNDYFDVGGSIFSLNIGYLIDKK